MQPNHRLGFNTGQGTWGWLGILAVLWNELAGSQCGASFGQEFRRDLEHLGRFQNDFPKAPPDVLIGLLEEKVIDTIRERFSRNGILMLRARLNRSN